MFDLETFHLYFDFPARGDQKDGDGDEGKEREGKEAMEDLKMIPSNAKALQNTNTRQNTAMKHYKVCKSCPSQENVE